MSRQRMTAVIAAIGFLTIIWMAGGYLGNTMQQSVTESQKESLLNAITRSMIHCYAVRGVYPESLDYIKEHYGITWDENQYLVDYEVIGANLRPDVSVFSRS